MAFKNNFWYNILVDMYRKLHFHTDIFKNQIKDKKKHRGTDLSMFG
jgi:hypothetical protein